MAITKDRGIGHAPHAGRTLEGSTPSGAARVVTGIRAWVDENPRPSALVMSVVAVGAMLAGELVPNGTDIAKWDLLFDSAVLTVVLGLWLTIGLDERFSAMVTRLANRGALERDGSAISEDDLIRIKQTSEASAQKCQLWTSITLAIVVATVCGVVIAMGKIKSPLVAYPVTGPLLGALGGFMVGRCLGRILPHSLFGRTIERENVSFRATPGHVDGAAGLKPLGSYYLYQAFVLAVPAVFFLAWSIILLFPEWHRRYPAWRAPYLGLLAAAVCLELFGFLGPLWRAHKTMKSQKNEAIMEVDKVVAPTIVQMKAELADELDADRRTVVRDRHEHLISSYQEIERMPTWPVDRILVRRVTLGNVALMIPLVAQVTVAATTWQKL
jgi:hypothetical protein